MALVLTNKPLINVLLIMTHSSIDFDVINLTNETTLSISKHDANLLFSFNLAPAMCAPRHAGSLCCLRDGLSRLSSVLDGLSYQLELTDTFDSGHGTEEENEEEEEEEDTDVESLVAGGAKQTQFLPCPHCSRVTNEVIRHLLTIFFCYCPYNVVSNRRM